MEGGRSSPHSSEADFKRKGAGTRQEVHCDACGSGMAVDPQGRADHEVAPVAHHLEEGGQGSSTPARPPAVGVPPAHTSSAGSEFTDRPGYQNDPPQNTKASIRAQSRWCYPSHNEEVVRQTFHS